MDKPIAALDIGTGFIKLLVGYELGGLPIVLYAKKIPSPGLGIDNHFDEDALIEALTPFGYIEDQDIKLNLKISEVSLVVPNDGLAVYQDTRTTYCTNFDGTGTISKVDLANLTTMIRNTPLSDTHAQIISIIPDLFVLEDGSSYIDPPIGVPSSSLTANVKIHTLPKGSIDDLTHSAQNANLKVKRVAVASFCQCNLFAAMPDLPESYLLVDYGHTKTSVSLVGEGAVYSSIMVPTASLALTEEISRELEINLETAETLKTKYGYNPRSHSFITPIYEENGIRIYRSQLNDIISRYIGEYLNSLQTAITTLTASYGHQMDNLPLLFTGGGSLLKGLSSFLPSVFPARKSYFPTPTSIGARDPAFAGALGMVLFESRYAGVFQDNLHGAATLEREAPKDNKKSKKKMGDSSLEDDL